MKLRLFTLVSLLTVGLLALCGCSDSKGKHFTVGFDPDSKPFAFVENGKYCGFDLDLAREVAKRNNWQIVFKKIDWETKDAELNTGNIDCLWSCFTIDGRENDYAWSKPYMQNYVVVIVKNDSAINSLAGLAGKTVSMQVETSAQQILGKRGARRDIGAIVRKQILTANVKDAIADLNSGIADAVVLDHEVAKEKISGGKYRILPEPLVAEKYGVGFAKDNVALRDAVQKTLDEMISDGTAAKISRRYFGSDVLIAK